MKYNPFKGALIVSVIVIVGAIMIHSYNNPVNNWTGFMMWLPLYISPVWGLAGMSWYSELGSID